MLLQTYDPPPSFVLIYILCKSTLAEPALHSPTGPPRGAAEQDSEAAGAVTEGSGNPVEARSTACFRSNFSTLWDLHTVTFFFFF